MIEYIEMCIYMEATTAYARAWERTKFRAPMPRRTPSRPGADAPVAPAAGVRARGSSTRPAMAAPLRGNSTEPAMGTGLDAGGSPPPARWRGGAPLGHVAAAGVAAADAARPRLRLLVIPASSKSLTSTFFRTSSPANGPY